ncbi:MAG: electron transfer flavoprotein subunit beta/FixA family protein [Desulfurococcales archaeon]|nr:electron transfer flavoprotein subunit beta/FixA family protein [Desulfurococcales archaeon]
MGDLVVLVKAALNPELVRSSDGDRLDLDSVPLKLSDIDRNAVEEAARLKSILGGKLYSITVLTWGPASLREKDLRLAVQEALAKGVDEAIVVADDSAVPGDQVLTANIIVGAIKSLGLKPDIIIAAEESIDEGTGQIPGRVASKLGFPYVSFVRKIDVSDGKIIVERDLEEVVEVVEAPLPAVVSVTQEINDPRPPTLIQIRRASKKPIRTLKLSDLNVEPVRKRAIRELRIIKEERKGVVIEAESVDKAADRLLEILESEGILK